MVYLGINLKELRTKEGLTQEQLAYEFDVSSQSISRWENGSTYPDVVMLPVIASYFNVSIDTLVGYAKECTVEEREMFFAHMRDMNRQEQIAQYREMLKKYPKSGSISNRSYAYQAHLAADPVCYSCVHLAP